MNASLHDQELARDNTGGTGDPAYVSNRPNFHPAPRVRVDTRVRSGKSSRRTRERVLAEARSRGYWPFRLCYEAGLRHDQKLSGQTRIRFTLPRSGRARRAHLVTSELADEDVVKCLVRRVSGLHLHTPIPSTLGVELSIELWPGDVPVLAVREGPATSALAGDATRPALDAIETRIADCYRAGLARDAALWGRIQLRMQVDAEGVVRSVQEDENQFPDPDVTRCVQAAVAAVRFPILDGGGLTLGVGVRLGRRSEPTLPDK